MSITSFILFDDDRLFELNKNKILSYKREIVGSCSVCGGKGVMPYVENGRPKIKACECLIQFKRISRYLKANVPVNKILNINGNYFEKNCIQCYFQRSICDEEIIYETYNTKKQRLYKDIIPYYMENINNGASIMFLGPNGCGKTVTAFDLFEKVAQNEDYKLYYILFRELINLSFSIKGRSKDKDFAYWLYDYILNCDFLILDELGKEIQNERIEQDVQIIIENIIKYRVENGLSTVIVTNYMPDDLSSKYTDSIMSILNEKYIFILLDNRIDYRFKK